MKTDSVFEFLDEILTQELVRSLEIGQTVTFLYYKSLIIASIFLKQADPTNNNEVLTFAQGVRLLMTGKNTKLIDQLPDLIQHQNPNFPHY